MGQNVSVHLRSYRLVPELPVLQIARVNQAENKGFDDLVKMKLWRVRFGANYTMHDLRIGQRQRERRPHSVELGE